MKNLTLIFKIIQIILLFIELPTKCIAQEHGKILENMVFDVFVTENNLNGTIHELKNDRIRFKSGKVNSDFSIRNGFYNAVYSLDIDSNRTPPEIHFKAKSLNSDKNTLIWNGEIMGDSISGKASRTRTRDKGCDYVFRGSLRK